MDDFLQISFMTLQGLSTSVFDMFFIFAIMIGYLVLARFNLVNIYTTMFTKKPSELIIEFIVQGIVIGVVLSLAIVWIGIPLIYTEYLYFLLPLSFLLGFWHIRYNNIIYSGMVVSLLTLIFKGQDLGFVVLPVVDFNVAGLLAIVGLLLVVEGVLLYLLRNNEMVPIIAKKEDELILGFAFQRFWPIPVVLLVAAKATGASEAVTMPGWWPILTSTNMETLGLVLFMLPLIFVVSHGAMSFTKSPQKLMKEQSITYLMGGCVLTMTGLILPSDSHLDFIGVAVFVLVAIGIYIYETWSEEKNEAIYPLSSKGVRVMHVIKEGLGERSGILPGDLIYEINGQKVINLMQFQAVLKMATPKMELKVLRDLTQRKSFAILSKDLVMDDLEVVYVPQQPEKVYTYSRIKNMGMLKYFNQGR